MSKPLATAFTALALLACASAPPPPPVATSPMFDGLVQVAAWDQAQDVVIFATAQQFLSHRQFRRGYEYFREQSARFPDRPLYAAWEAVFRGKMADEVPLLSRIGWVKDTVALADGAVAKGGAAQAPALRLVRGLLLAGVPGFLHQADRAREDLQYVLAHREVFDFDPSRAIYRGLAEAAKNGGRRPEAARYLAAAGASSLDDPLILDGRSAAPAASRMTSERARSPAPDILVLEGYDFADLVFLRGNRGVIAVDAGSNAASFRRGIEQARAHWGADLEVGSILFTHAHWDHVGGVGAAPHATVRVGQERFPAGLARTNENHPPFSWFFPGPERPLDIALTDVISTAGRVVVDGRAFDVHPIPGGETADGLVIVDVATGTAFVGDAFMPYLGAPTEAEGSPEGLLETLALLERIGPRRLVHGHPQLSWFIPVETVSPLRKALAQLLSEERTAIRDGRGLEEFKRAQTVPDLLRDAPRAAFAYLVLRDGFVSRTWHLEAGYWPRSGDVDRYTRHELARAVSLLAHDGPDAYVAAIDKLRAGGDEGLALEIVKLGLEVYPNDERLRGRRAAALGGLGEQVHLVDPFRFFVYSQLAGRVLPRTTPITADGEAIAGKGP